jgi:tetratricopeptide (TPR) repeat protein/transcriptional regulator with XRE-family HTH domain
MRNESRTALGDLLHRWRRQLGLSQKDVSDRTGALNRRDDTVSPISVRTINSLERPTRDGGRARRPRRDTAHSLASALGLAAGSADYVAFMTAAGYPRAEPATETPAGDDPAPAFVDAGREQPLLRLSRALDDAAIGTPVAVIVRGERGMGKTALIDHASRLAIARHDAVVLRAAAVPGDRPHGPFIRVIRQMLGELGPADGPVAAHANRNAIAGRVETAAHAFAEDGPLLAAIALDASDGERVAGRVGDAATAERLRALAGAAPDERMRSVPGCEQFFRVISRYAKQGPVILVLEDLDRSDPATLASLDHLLGRMHRRGGLPLAVIVSSLPDDQLDPGSPELGQVLEDLQRLYPHGTIDLADTASPAAARAFAEAMLAAAELPGGSATVDALLARTDGHPRYVSALLDALASSEGDADVSVGMAEAIPAPLDASIAAQIDQLPPGLQHIIMTASVLGADFYAEALMQMLDLPTERFIELVDRQLWRRHRLLRAAGTATVDGRVMHRYRFHPPLLRDVLYRQLSDLERTHAHSRAADALIDLHGAADHDRLDRLAAHLERGGRRREAARVYLRAGERARSRRDFDAARRLLEPIARLGARRDDPETWVQAQITLGLCARAVGDPRTARTCLSRALDLAAAWPEASVRAKALEALGMLDFDAGDLERGRQHILDAIDIWAARNSPDTSRALANLSYILYGLGQYDDAIASAERARIEGTRAGEERSWLDGTIALANCWLELGLHDRATDLYEHALLIGGELGDAHRQRLCWVNLALVGIERGDWGAAELAIDRVTDGAESVGDALLAAAALYSGEISEGRHNLVAATAHFRHALDIRVRESRDATVVDALAGLLRVATATGDIDAAAERLADIERRLARRGLDGVERIGKLYLALVRASDALGRSADAQRWLREGVLALNARAGTIADPGLRESYLNTPPAHRWLMQEAGKRSLVMG